MMALAVKYVKFQTMFPRIFNVKVLEYETLTHHDITKRDDFIGPGTSDVIQGTRFFLGTSKERKRCWREKKLKNQIRELSRRHLFVRTVTCQKRSPAREK